MSTPSSQTSNSQAPRASPSNLLQFPSGKRSSTTTPKGPWLDLPFQRVALLWDEIDKRGTYLPAMRMLAQQDRYYLLTKILGRRDCLHPWLYERCREVERAPDGYLDLWARDHYKSTLITYAGAIQEILKDPNITIGIFSHTKTVAKAFLMQIKRSLEASEVLKALFPDILWENPAKDASVWSVDTGLVVKRASNPKECTLEAHGLVDGQPIGKHFKLRVYDDVVVPESVSTPEQIAKTTEAMELSEDLGMEGGRSQAVGTRYHFADTYSVMLERGWKPRIHAATHNGKKDGTPVFLSAERWADKLLRQSDATIACQQLLNPLEGSSRVFDVNDLREYEVRPDAMNVYVMVDPARSKKKDSANTAMAVLGVDEQGKKYLLDGFDHQMDLMERWQNMRDLWAKWRRAPGVQGIKVGYEVYGAQADMDYFEERKKTEGIGFEIELLAWPHDGPGSKDDRIQRLLPDIRSHALFGPYDTNDETITAHQARMIHAGYEHRIASAIVKRDHEGVAYNLWERFRLQLSMYPFIERKDLIDAVSRIYDMTPSPPSFIDSQILEPDYV